MRARRSLIALAVLASSCAGSSEPADPHAGHTTGATSPAPTLVAAPEGGLWGSALAPPAAVEPFELTDQEGRPFRFPADVRDADVTLLYLGYTHCADICPDTMAEIAVALREAPPEVADRVAVVFVTVDPARDDPERLRAWIGQFGEDFVGLTGPQARIDRILRSLGFAPATFSDLGGGEYTVGHPVEYLAVAPDGTVRLSYPWEVTMPQLEQDLVALVEEGWP